MSIDQAIAGEYLSTLVNLSSIPGTTAGHKATTAPTGGRSPQSTVNFSPISLMLNQLTQLQQQDAVQFTKLMNSIADQLARAARTDDTTAAQQQLTDLAQHFQQAARTGDLTKLQPQQTAGPRKHPDAPHHYGDTTEAQPDLTHLPTVGKAMEHIFTQVAKAVKTPG